MRQYYSFPALLKTEYNDIEETGYAQIIPRGDALNFYGEFVPLVPLGHRASIYWVLGDKALAEFEGDTYLSTSEMLQLTNLNGEKLETARTLFLSNIELEAVISNTASKKGKLEPVKILYLSMGLIKLISPHEFTQGQTLYLSAQVDFFTLHALRLTVHKKLDFYKGEKMLLCEVDSMSEENYIALSTYTAKLEKQWQLEQEE